MELKKLAPWNWFKKEEEMQQPAWSPVQKHASAQGYHPGHTDPFWQLHHTIDRLLEQWFSTDPGIAAGELQARKRSSLDHQWRPEVDLAATETTYQLTVDIPGVRQEDIALELEGNTLLIRGEKKQEQEQKDTNFYRLERRYGCFQRILSLPEDVDRDHIRATFNQGVLQIFMPRKSIPGKTIQKIAITPQPE